MPTTFAERLANKLLEFGVGEKRDGKTKDSRLKTPDSRLKTPDSGLKTPKLAPLFMSSGKVTAPFEFPKPPKLTIPPPPINIIPSEQGATARVTPTYGMPSKITPLTGIGQLPGIGGQWKPPPQLPPKPPVLVSERVTSTEPFLGSELLAKKEEPSELLFSQNPVHWLWKRKLLPEVMFSSMIAQKAISLGEQGMPAEKGDEAMARMRERFANDPNPIIRMANTPTVLGGLTPADLVGLGLIAYGGYLGIKSLIPVTKDLADKTLQMALNTGLDKWIAQRSRGVPPQYVKTIQNFLYNNLVQDKVWLQQRATENMLNRMGRGVNAAQAARVAVDDTISNFEGRLTALVPRGTQTGAMAFGGRQAGLTKALWDATPVAQRVLNAESAGLSGQVGSKAFEALTATEKTALGKIAAPVTPTPEVTKRITRTTKQQDIQETAKILSSKLKESGIPESDIPDLLGVYNISETATETRASLTFEQLRNLADEGITEDNVRKLTREILAKEFGVPSHEVDLVLEGGSRVNPRLDIQQAEIKAREIDNLIKRSLPTRKDILASINKAIPTRPVTPAPEVTLPKASEYWAKDLSNYKPLSSGHEAWGKGQAGFNITRDGKINLTDNRRIRDYETDKMEFPTHRELGPGFSGLYSFNTYEGEPTQLWLYPDAEKNLTPEMKNGLASLIGIHKITPNTPVYSNGSRKILFRLKDTDFYKQATVAVPKAEIGQPEAGLQPSMLPKEIAAKEVRPVTPEVINPFPSDNPNLSGVAIFDIQQGTGLLTPADITAEADIIRGKSEVLLGGEGHDLLAEAKAMGAGEFEGTALGENPRIRFDETKKIFEIRYDSDKALRDRFGLSEQDYRINLQGTVAELKERYPHIGISIPETGEFFPARVPKTEPAIPKAEAVTPTQPPVPTEVVSEAIQPSPQQKVVEVAPPQQVVAPAKPEAPKTPVQRREEIKALLAEPAKNLPKGTTKIALRNELAQLNKSLIPQEKKLRQQIMAQVKVKGLPEKQYRAIFKDTGGARQLSTIGLPKLESVLKAIQRARPKSIGGKKVASLELEQQIQDTKQKLNVSNRDYEAIKSLFNIRNDRFIDSRNFISQRDATRLIKAMKRKSLIGFADIEEAVKNLVFSLGPPTKMPTPITRASFDVPWGRKLGDKINSFLARTYRVERILDKLDGKDNGPLWSAFYKPLNEATTQKVRGYYGKMKEFRNFITENNINLSKLLSDRVEIQPGLSLSSSEKIGVYLSSLNPDNLRHLKEGNKFTDETIDTIKNSLSEQEKQITDWLKAYFENEHPAVSEAKLYVTDEPLDKVENYFPIRLQWKANPALDYWEQIAREDSYRFATDWASAGIPKGFTKPRTQEAIQAVDLDALSIFLNHLEAVEHYKAFAPVIADLQIILKNNVFRSAFIDKAGWSAYQVLDKWLKQTAEINPLRPANQAEALIRTMRVNATTAVLGLNLTTAMKQFPSFVSGAAETGVIPALNGLLTYGRHPVETRQLIKQFSPQIYQRSFEREIAEAQKMRGPGKILAGKLSVREVFMIMTTTMDKMAVSGLWRGSFDDGVSKGLSPEQAAAKAEEVIRKTQPFFDVKDLPEYYRSGEFMKALTIFTNQLNNYWNYYTFDIAGKYGAGRISTFEVLKRVLLAFVIPALMIGAISRSRPAKNVKELIIDLASMGIATIPLAGSWITSGIKGFTDNSLITTELASEIASLSNKVTRGKWDTMWQDILTAGGYATGVPVAQTKRTIKAMVDLATDKTDDWLELIWGKYVREEAEEKFSETFAKDFAEYDKIPSNPDELRAAMRTGEVRLSRSDYREANPDVDAKLFIAGEVQTIKTLEAYDRVKELVKQGKIKPAEISAVRSWQQAEERRKELGVEDEHITDTERLIMELLGIAPTPKEAPSRLKKAPPTLKKSPPKLKKAPPTLKKKR